MKYGDAVVLVQKSRDGGVRRTNAIVLGSNVHAVKDQPAVEHLDLAFPVLSLAPGGTALKTRNLEEIFRPAYNVAPWVEDAWVGYERVAPADQLAGALADADRDKTELGVEVLELKARKPWTELTEEEKDATTYPTWDGIVTRSGKTEADLAAEQAAIRQENGLPSVADLDAAATEHAGGETVQVKDQADTQDPADSDSQG